MSNVEQKIENRRNGSPWTMLDAAEFLGVCKATIERACRSEKIKTFNMGRRVFISDEEVKRLAREGF